MEIICSHENLDFDGLASMIGAQKLFKDAKMVLPGKLSQPVKEFLALYKDTFDFYSNKDLQDHVKNISTVIMVDTNQFQRTSKIALQAVKLGARLIIFDHHPQTLNLDLEYEGIIETIGATATIIVEKIQAEGLTLNPIEATVLALGIYQDTGSLQFLGTSYRDAQAVAYLLASGARLKVINTFLDRPLNLEQQQLYNILLNNAQEIWINGNYVLLVTGKTSNYVGGMAFIARKLGELYNADAIILIVASRRQVDLIARSKVEWVRVDKLMAEFGGGGHNKAASAKVKDGSLSQVIDKTKDLLPVHISPPLTAKDIMNSPVKSVRSYQTIEEAARLLLRYGHSGMPVVEEGQLIGIISRRDVDKGIRHDLGHAPVKAYMSRNVKIVQPNTPITQIEELMIENDIGRLPVCQEGSLVGIVTRSDLLRTTHEEYKGKFSTNFRHWCPISGLDTEEYLYKSMDKGLIELLALIGELGNERREKVFLVGGIVRDLIIGAPNIDVDIVVEGSAPELAMDLAKKLGAKIRTHETFQTATVFIPKSYKLDFASTRTEFYAYPAALPTIESAKLREDLYRRDFTVNAMAISLNPKDFGQLVDYFCGYSDLQDGLIRVLHNLSFVEDPTRIIRALRFAIKFGWQIEDETYGFMERAIKEERLQDVSPIRLWNELKNILLEDEPVPILKELNTLGIDKQLFFGLGWSKEILTALDISAKTIPQIIENIDLKPWIIYLGIIMSPFREKNVQDILKKYALKRDVKRVIEDVLILQEKFPWETFVPSRQSIAQCYSFWHRMANETIIIWGILSREKEILNLVIWYLENRDRLKPVLTGHDLLALGAIPGKRIGEILQEIEIAWIVGKVSNEKEEQEFAQKLIKGG